MSRKLLRTVCTGALAAATALTGVTGIAPAGAAAPGPQDDPPAEAPIAWADPAGEPVGPVDPGAGPVEPAGTGADPVGGTAQSEAVTREDGTAQADGMRPEAPTAPVSPADPAAASASPADPDGVLATPDAPAAPVPPGAPLPPGSPDSPAGTSPPAATDDAAALPPSGGDSVSALLTRMRTLYQQAEEATERFNAAEETLKVRTADTKKVTARLTAARTALAQGRAAAGRIARDQYQGRSELSSYLRLLFASDPQSALDQGHLMARASRDRATAVSRLEGAERQADALATAARKALDRQQTLAAAQRTRRDEVRARLAEVEKLLAALSPEQLARLTELERTQTAGAQRELLDSGVLDGRRTPSRAGAEALRFAVGQIGKPYEWGAEGPEAYDCSGLTQRAWAAAGREVPRTSQEQWAELPRVPLTELRPGDLVVYFPGATHVALYLGEGLVVQAPRPGGRVKVSPIAANPLLGAVRPDEDGEPLAAYTPPELPAGAREGGDEGYDRGDGAGRDGNEGRGGSEGRDGGAVRDRP
ncbi:MULTISPECIES: C40 family peptidase [unclassified Streptomyces]|uniref:C40 family peptidase n=1 Tax=unclassified Streptomyces TaxID=2593676 RepID=UPI00099F022D|nr:MULTISPECIES: C40 family peptidase [unclassified Streptomyces]